jgi:hypothetical protein
MVQNSFQTVIQMCTSLLCPIIFYHRLEFVYLPQDGIPFIATVNDDVNVDDIDMTEIYFRDYYTSDIQFEDPDYKYSIKYHVELQKRINATVYGH